MPLVVDGVTISVVAEAYIGAPPNLGVVAHELGHLLSDLPDLYFALRTNRSGTGIPFDNPFAAGDYCLMDATYNNAHFCPFLRLKLGLAPAAADLRSGHYQLRAIESSTRSLGADPSGTAARASTSSSRIEFKDGSYDMNLPDRGLGVWHMIEDPAIYGSNIPPRAAECSGGVATGSLGAEMGR